MARELAPHLQILPDFQRKVAVVGSAVSTSWRNFCQPKLNPYTETSTFREELTELAHSYHDWFLGVGTYTDNNPYHDFAGALRSVRRTFRR